MDRIIGEWENEKNIRDRIKREYDIAVQRGESDEHIIFSAPNDEMQSMLELVPRAVAMRRNSPSVNTRRFPSMTDIDRVETKLISTASTKGGYHKEGVMGKLLSGALAYQNQIQIPICLVTGSDESSRADFFRHFGFQCVYDRPRYALNRETISQEMLAQAVAGETVCLDAPNITLQTVDREEMLSLAHFVNTRLCREYGLFMIRSAAYYEEVMQKLQGSGGNLFQIMEDGIRKGCFVCANTEADSIRDAVFEQTFNTGHYLLKKEDQSPAVMARIVNMSEMLRHITGNGRITIAIQIKDPVIAENDGLFIWYIDESGSHMEHVEQPGAVKGNDSSMRPEVTTTIGEFTAFLFAYTKLKQNAKFDSIYLAGPAWMDGIL